MKTFVASLLASIIVCIPTAHAQFFHANTQLATLLIISYDVEGNILGRGSGFYVDEGIAITNIHVIDGYARYYRIFITDEDGRYDSDCYKDITRSDIKLNLEDDVAYIRVYIDCPHTSVYFADEDPAIDSEISVYGYPALGGTFYSSFNMIKTDGSVVSEWPAKVGLKEYRGPWLLTDAIVHGGNSGGPVVQDGKVVGIAVAAHEDGEGESIDGLFIPVSIVRSGLEDANNSTFGYTPQEQQKNYVYVEPEPEFPYGSDRDPFNPLRVMKNATNEICETSLGEGGEATGYGECRCKPSYHQNDSETTCLPGAENYVDPYSTLNKQIASTKISNGNVKYQNTFVDVTASRKGFEAIESLKERGVINGYRDGTFRPDDNVNRAELLKILVEGFFSAEIRGEEDCFSDVRNEWFAPYVCAAARLGWVEGYDDGTFRPANTINRAEAIKIIISSLSEDRATPEEVLSDVPEGSWFHGYVSSGLQFGILPQMDTFYPADSLTREDAAMWIFNGTVK